MIDQTTFYLKKVFIGSEEITDVDTGEMRIVKEFAHKETDINWENVWLKNLLWAIGLVSDKSIKVLVFFIENRNYENKVFVNKRMVIDSTGFSKTTVYKVIDALESGNVIKKLVDETGYQVNPDIIFNTLEAKRKKINRLEVRVNYYGHKAINKRSFEYLTKRIKK